ncbi:hypothetical protein QQS21_008620 [Conoideocrella luteorostrata]|uniref:DUF3295 domain-containing protein n=1 Tax=Conoideocrella luteorostrata TaxID=1105319 RepID=A0AAJ0CLA7_9HYPO|nr:hypothetical protein QQS21_008620 [Conoideocrella luteorostrata]
MSLDSHIKTGHGPPTCVGNSHTIKLPSSLNDLAIKSAPSGRSPKSNAIVGTVTPPANGYTPWMPGAYRSEQTTIGLPPPPSTPESNSSKDNSAEGKALLSSTATAVITNSPQKLSSMLAPRLSHNESSDARIGDSLNKKPSACSVQSAVRNLHRGNRTTQALRQGESAVRSGARGEHVHKSAIGDGDDTFDWEDDIEDDGKSSIDDTVFQRIECTDNLASRPSLITLMLAQNERANLLTNNTSQPPPPIQETRVARHEPCMGEPPKDPDEALPMRSLGVKPISKVPRSSSAQPITAIPTPILYQAALSPQATRRNMVATELSESLRCNMLLERQQKTKTSQASLKRRHTSHDVANLKQYPCMKASEDAVARSWNEYLLKDAFNGYHSRGW